MAAAGPRPAARAGIAPLMLRSWLAPRAVLRRLAGMPDRVLVVILLSAMLFFFLGQLPVHARLAALDPATPLAPRLGGAALAVMFLMPLIAYGVAQLAALASRLTPWRLASRDSRLALFWALLAVSPAMLLAGLTEGFVGPGPALTLVRAVAGLGFFGIWLAGITALVTRRAP